jgi:hypothetical protein
LRHASQRDASIVPTMTISDFIEISIDARAICDIAKCVRIARCMSRAHAMHCIARRYFEDLQRRSIGPP